MVYILIYRSVIMWLSCDLSSSFRRNTLRWRHNERDCVSSHQPYHCLFNRSFWRRSKKTPKLRVTGLCVGNSPGTGEFPAQMASNAENVFIWWRHHDNEVPFGGKPYYLDPLLLTWINLNPAWISNYVHNKLWDEITYPFSNFNGGIVEVWKCISNFSPQFTGRVITCPCWG